MDSDRVVPELTDAQWDRLVRYGVPADVAAGEILVPVGRPLVRPHPHRER